MRTLKNILLGTAISMLGIAGVHGQGGNGWSVAGPRNIAGRVLAIHIDVANDQRVYAGTAGGGLWISTNEGQTWFQSNSFTGSAAVSAITQSSDGTLYLGTGEGLNRGSVERYADPGVVTNNFPYGIKGDGVYKSTDQGLTFVRLSGTEGWTEVNSIAYDNQNNKLYVATNEGLKISSDGGGSFQDANGPLPTKGVCVKVGNDGTVIYSDIVTVSGSIGNVYVSTDRGATFHSVCGSLPQLPNAGSGRISVDIAPSDPNVMYALVTYWDGYFDGVYVSKNKGENWRLIFPFVGVQNPIYNNRNWGSFCNALSVSPIDPTEILLGSLYLYRAKEWNTEQYYASDPVSYSALFLHNICYTKNNTAYLATNTGIYSANLSTNTISNRNNYLTTLQAYTLGVGNDGRLMIGARDNGTILLANPNGAAKTGKNLTSIYADGADCVFSMIKSDALFYSGSYGYCYRQASLYSDPQEPAQWMGGSAVNTDVAPGSYFYINIINQRAGDEYTRWHCSNIDDDNKSGLSGLHTNSYVSPLAIWESINDENSIDSVLYTADKTYLPGDTICVKSKRNNYPIWMKYTGTDTLRRDSVLYVKDIVTSRLFIGGSGYLVSNTVRIPIGGAPVFMTTNALDFINSSPFVCVFRTKDTTEQVMDLLPTKDGNHLFILTKKYAPMGSRYVYSIYRVSGFDMYRTPEQMDVSEAVHNINAGLQTDNMRRELEDNVLVKDTSLNILGITLDHQDNNRLIFVTNSGSRIYEITDALTAIDGNANLVAKEGEGIPESIVVYCAIVEMLDGDIAYIGTEEGVYKTTDFTSSNPKWELYNQGMNTKVPVFKLYQQTNYIPNNRSVEYDGQGQPSYLDFQGVSNYRTIYAATHGLGIFMDDTYWDEIPEMYFPTGGNNTLRMNVFPNPATASITVDFTVTQTNNVQITLSDITGRMMVTKSLGTRMIGNHQEKIDCSALSEGFYFVTINAGYQNQTAKIIIRK